MNTRLLTFLKFFIGWPVSLIALIFIISIILPRSTKVLPLLTSVNIPLLLSGIVCFVVYFFVRGYLWKTILEAFGGRVTLSESAYLWASSEMRRFIPGAIWAPLTKSMIFTQKTGLGKKTAVSALITETCSLAIAGLFMALFAYDFILDNIPHIGANRHFLFSFILISIICITAVFLLQGYIINVFRKNHLLSHTTILRFLVQLLFPRFGFLTNGKLLLIGLLAQFLFGMGTYVTITSVVFLSPIMFLTFVGFFVSSFIIGYLSLFIPMGLGIREGVITLGLSKIIPLATAGFVSIFARIVMLLSELLFILLAYILGNTPLPFVRYLKRTIMRYKHEALLLCFVLCYSIYFITVSFLKYDNFYVGRFDLGNMAQTVWNTAHGNIFQLTNPDRTNITSRLAIHADFILIALAPFYYIWENPKMLLLIQTLIVACGALFVFLIGKTVLKHKTISLVLALCYLLNPSVQYTNMYDFHAVTLSTTFLLGMWYFLLKKKYVYFLFFTVLAALTKEQIWLILGILGIFLFIQRLQQVWQTRRKQTKNEIFLSLLLPVFFTLCSFFIFYLLIWHFIPGSKGGNHFALEYYADYGSSPTQIVTNFITSPTKLFMTVLSGERLEYLVTLLSPLGFLPLLFPFPLIFAFPDLMINILSNNTNLHQIYYQYTAAITPFLFIATIYSLRLIRQWNQKISYNMLSLFLLSTTLLSAYYSGPLPGAKSPSLAMFTRPQTNKEEIHAFLSAIPPQYSVAATNNIGAHVSHRTKIFTIPRGMDEADMLIFLLGDHFAKPSPTAQEEMVQQLKNDKQYMLVFEKGRFFAFQKIH